MQCARHVEQPMLQPVGWSDFLRDSSAHLRRLSLAFISSSGGQDPGRSSYSRRSLSELASPLETWAYALYHLPANVSSLASGEGREGDVECTF